MPRHPLRRLVAVTVGALVATAGTVLATAVPAHADVTDPNMLMVNNGVTFESCNDVPYSLKPLSDWGSAQSHAMGNVFGTYTYDVDLKVIGPDGTEADTDSVYRNADDTSAYGDDTGAFFVCDGSGTYVVQASGYWCWINYTPQTGPQYCQTVSFKKSFSLRAAKTKATLKGASAYRISNKPLKLTAVVEIERSTGTFAFGDANVKLQYQKGSRWVTYRTSSTNRAGKVAFSVSFANAGLFKIRAVVSPDEDYAGSKSRVKKVRVTR